MTARTLGTLDAHRAWAQTGRRRPRGDAGPYGQLQRTSTRNTGEALLALPTGFSYVVLSQSGRPMTDGSPTPVAFDGMAAFAGPDGVVRLIRNHELRTLPGTASGRVEGDPTKRYDPLGVGGTVTLDYDPRRQETVREFVSLNGTIVNCAGGIMHNAAGWLTCEETVAGPNSGWAKKHGYCFEVPLGASPGQPAQAIPIPAMGRFSHEAVAVDPANGWVYETEDMSSSPNGFFRYRPTVPTDLNAGGVLEMLKVRGTANKDLREGISVGSVFPVEFVMIDDPDPDLEGGASSCYQQGAAGGGAKFNRLEGCWYGNGRIYFVSTSGGSVKNGDSPGTDGYVEGYGQLWEFTPESGGGSRGTLRLVYESPGRDTLDSPDNLNFTPRGGILMCEDDASRNDRDTHPLAPGIDNVNRLIGLGLGGEPFEFAVNIADGSEFAGACFSPDSSTLFVNTFGDADEDAPGRTYAVWGPWHKGPL